MSQLLRVAIYPLKTAIRRGLCRAVAPHDHLAPSWHGSTLRAFCSIEVRIVATQRCLRHTADGSQTLRRWRLRSKQLS